MNPNLAPTYWADEIKDIFINEAPVFGQVATVDGSGNPALRTVHFHLENGETTIAFNTHVRSEKWGHLKNSGKIECCSYFPGRGYQLRWSGPIEQLTTESKSGKELLERRWLGTREDVRQEYWRDYAARNDSDPIENSICPWFGTVVCVPHKWEIYVEDPDFSLVKRFRYVWENKDWQKTELTSLHSF